MVHNYRQSMQTKSTPKCTVSIVGARGYSGVELAKLLVHHPHADFRYAFATKDFQLSDDIVDGSAVNVKCLTEDQLDSHLTDVVFLATPAETSIHLAAKILKAGKKVIDLSGAFRLKKSDINKWYGFENQETALLQEAEYGLAPFCGPSKSESRLIANPGCYATAVSLALIPLLKHNLIDAGSICIDAKSGTTGAGRKAGENLLFSEVDGDCLPYKVGKHQHFPEIQETVEKFSGAKINPHFVTELLPCKRGILATIMATAKTTDITAIEKAFLAEYGQYPLVRHGRNIAQLAKLSHVVNTPFAHISYELTENKLYVFSVLDNLMKGAASQAVENFNRLLDLPLSFSLTTEAPPALKQETVG